MADHLYNKVCITLSNYASQLPSDAKGAYIQKLTVRVKDNKDKHVYRTYYLRDPYLAKKEESGEWVNDSRPKLQFSYGDLYTHLFEKSKEYTKSKLKHYRQTAAYNYVAAGKVSPMQFQRYEFHGKSFEMIRGQIQRSMKTRELPHRAWLLLFGEGGVETAHCTCAAGLSETCSHVAAMLFQLFEINEKPQVGCTDVQKVWNKPSSNPTADNMSKRLQDMNYEKPKIGSPKKKKLTYKAEKGLKKESSPHFLERVLNSGSVSMFSKLYAPITVTTTDDCRKIIPPPFLQYMNAQREQHGSITKETITSWLQLYTEEACEAITAESTAQRNSLVWMQQRVGRLGSSMFGEICTVGHRKSILTRIIKEPRMFNLEKIPPSLAWGCKKESIAFQRYVQSEAPKHQSFSCTNTGLHISKDFPMLCSSPDGLVSCTCCGDGVLEIKCPYVARNEHPLSGGGKYKKPDDYFLTSDGDLNENHWYYYQVQGQMAITDREYCDLMVYTEVDIHIIRVRRDRDFWGKRQGKLTEYFSTVFTSYVVKTLSE